MPQVYVDELVDRSEAEIHAYFNGDTDRVAAVFREVCARIQNSHLYGGQPHGPVSVQNLALARLGKSLASVSGNERLEVEAACLMARALNAGEAYAESLAWYEQAIAGLERIAEHARATRVRLGFIFALSMTGDSAKAIDVAKDADKWFRANGDDLGHARLCVNLATVYQRLDEHTRSLECLFEAVEVFEKAGDETALTQTYLNIAVGLSFLDRFDESEEMYRLCEEMSARLGLEDLWIQARYNNTYLKFLRGRYSEALTSYAQLRTQFAERQSFRHAALCDLDQAELYLRLNLSSEAAVLAQRCTEVAEVQNMRYEEAKSKAFLGMAFAQAHQFGQALAAFSQSRALFAKEKNEYWTAQIDLYRADVLFSLGRLWESEALAASARKKFDELQHPLKSGVCKVLLARLALKLNRLKEAEGYAQSIFDITQTRRFALITFPAYSLCGEIAEHSGDLYGARMSYQRAAQQLEVHRTQLHHELGLTLYKGKEQVFEALVQLALLDEIHGPEDAFLWAEKAKASTLADLLAHHMGSVRSEADHTLLNRINRLREEMNSVYVRLRPDVAPLVQRDAGAADLMKEQELALTLRDISYVDPEYAALQSASVVACRTLQRVLPSDTTALEFFVAREEIIAFVISSRGLKVFRHLLPLSRVNYLHGRLRLQWEKAVALPAQMDSPQAVEAAQRLLNQFYAELFAPMADSIETSNVIIIPHKVLHYLPFHAFHDGNKYLGDRLNVTYAPSASVLVTMLQKKPVRNAVPLLVAVDDGQHRSVALETAILREAFPEARALCGPDSTKEAFVREGMAADFIHITTHMRLRQDNPMFSALQFEGSWMSPIDLYSISCNANLVAIGGYRTGFSQSGAGQDQLAIVRAFLYAGARSLLMSLWDAPAESTGAYYREMYHAWKNGMSKRAALKTATDAIRNAHPHPIHWSPFVLMGNPD
jgi:CHAT domain-containing protein/tetratricopeptide (TPR) repeat protein